ncbi:phosphatidate cytidylyltransferase [Anatilimnocola sp. NA78]|uniref:phosphatidate cytidylyltransferase n=1 Tax=Anatilimnocola sp. NA78 TaxID=3415683 RepID=UPI003CE49F17
MLRWRLLSSFIIIAVMLALVALDHREVGLGLPGVWLLPVLLIVTVLGTEEVISLLRNQNHRPVEWVTYVGSVGIALAGAEKLLKDVWAQFGGTLEPAWEGWPMLAVAGGVILAFGGEMARFRKAGEGAIVNAALALFAMIYVGGLMTFLAWQRLQFGTFAFLSIPIVVKFADTGAYTLGRLIGRHKMTPLLSPGKTWQGALGGVLTGCAASWLSFTYLQPALLSKEAAAAHASPPLIAILLYGLALTLAGMHGDLAESLLKRDMNRKDSSTWLPGLGGVLDIIDSVLIAAPVAYLFWHMGWVR